MAIFELSIAGFHNKLSDLRMMRYAFGNVVNSWYDIFIYEIHRHPFNVMRAIHVSLSR